MAEEHTGSLVLVDCGPSLGMYQGRISSVEPTKQTITLENPLRNGVPFQVPKVTLKSEDIVDLKILQLADEFDKAVNNVLTSCRGGAKTEINGASEETVHSDVHQGNGNGALEQGDQKALHGKTKVATKLQQRVHVSPGDLIYGGDQRKKSTKSASPNNFSRPRSRPNVEHQPYEHFERDAHGQQQFQQDGTVRKHNQLSDLCAPLDHDLMSTDFDFETNLAQFKKLPRHPDQILAANSSTAKQAAVLDQLLHGLNITSTRAASSRSPQNKNIRHDENIVQDPSRVYVNAKRTWRYITEDGIEVQTLTAVQKRQLYERALRSGWITQIGFVYTMADAAGRLCLQLLREKNLSESVSFYMVFDGGDTVPHQTAKHLSCFLINRGHSVTWIFTSSPTGNVEKERGVEVIADPYYLLCQSPPQRSFVFVIGRQGSARVDDVSNWLLKGSFIATMFIESDWCGVDSSMSEDLLSRLGMDAGSLIKLPSRVLLCWQLPCEEADSDLKSPVFVCDTNMPSHFVDSEVPALTKKSKPYKFPFGQATVVKLRKL